MMKPPNKVVSQAAPFKRRKGLVKLASRLRTCMHRLLHGKICRGHLSLVGRGCFSYFTKWPFPSRGAVGGYSHLWPLLWDSGCSHFMPFLFVGGCFHQARTQQGAQRARAPLWPLYSTVEYYDLPWHKRRRNINEHANVVQYKFHVKNAINSLYILSISWPEV